MSESTALITLTDQQVDLILKDVDITGLTAEEKHGLALALYDSYQENLDGFTYRPQKIIINKESQNFTLPTGETVREIKGVILYSKKTRAYYAPDQDDDDKVPKCASQDCINGKEPDVIENGIVTKAGKTKPCAGCQYDQWGTAVDEKGQPAAGKACKECRKAYLMLPGYEFPITLTVSPSSLRVWDEYMSALATTRKSTLAQEVTLTLSKAGEGKKTWAVLNPPATGGKVPPKDILKYHETLRKFLEVWKREAITRDDLFQGGEADTDPVPDGPTIDAAGHTVPDGQGGDPAAAGKRW
jgi:hypothetical protein